MNENCRASYSVQKLCEWCDSQSKCALSMGMLHPGCRDACTGASMHRSHSIQDPATGVDVAQLLYDKLIVVRQGFKTTSAFRIFAEQQN
eukprot:6201925-Pleurochrysis_carterae.AAC.1